MKRELFVWLFFIASLKVLSYSACQSTFTPKAVDKPYLKPEKQLNYLYDTNREGDQRRYEAVQAARPLRISQKAKAVYGGANDLKRPRHTHNGANSFLIRPCSGFLVLLRHVLLGLLVLVFFF